MTTKGLSERRSLTVIGMSASALHYQPRPANTTIPLTFQPIPDIA